MKLFIKTVSDSFSDLLIHHSSFRLQSFTELPLTHELLHVEGYEVSSISVAIAKDLLKANNMDL